MTTPANRGALARVNAAEIARRENQQSLLAQLCTSPTVPARYADTIPQEDWAVMDEAERLDGLLFLAAGEAATTEGLTGLDLPRIKHPTSETPGFLITGADGMPKILPEFSGVIVGKYQLRAYWPVDAPVVKGTLPTCKSTDLLLPDEDSQIKQHPTCHGCPRNRFGTGKDGEGMACKERINTFSVRPDEDIPSRYSVPSGSLVPFKAYTVLIKQDKTVVGGLAGVLTKFSVENATSKRGTSYKQLRCHLVEKLSLKAQRRFNDIATQFREAISKLGVMVDVGEDDGVIEAQAQPGEDPAADFNPDKFSDQSKL